jgi:hypothetical protein
MECQLKQLVINTERVRIELNARFPQNLEESKEEDVRQFPACGLRQQDQGALEDEIEDENEPHACKQKAHKLLSQESRSKLILKFALSPSFKIPVQRIATGNDFPKTLPHVSE